MKIFYIILSSVVGAVYFIYIVHLFRIGFTIPLYTQIPMLLTIGVITLWLFNKRTERRS